jgi:hypothetical protein
MTKNKHAARVRLAAAADLLSEEVWDGKWDHIAEVKAKPIGTWTEITEELEKRCPGYSQEEYQDALARSMFTHR